MKSFVKKNWKKILLVIIVLFFVNRIYGTFFKQEPVVETVLVSEVEVISLADIAEGSLDTFCSVEAASDAPVVAELSRKVTSVFVEDGQEVKKGQTLFNLENIAQRVAVENAKVSLRSAELALSELLGDNDQGQDGSLLAQTQTQQEILIEIARDELFNNDLQAYPEKNPENIVFGGPTIEGNYSCSQEGEYLVEVYSSGTDSGSSFRYSGLESGTGAASSSGYGTALGSCGLELVFPEDFDKRESWVIPVPNTRSVSYLNAQNSYDNAVSGKDIVINNTQASPERVAQERARVSQARLQLESAYESLSKTVIKASVAGTLSSFDINEGDFVTQNTELARVKSIGNLELVAYVNPQEGKYLSEGSEASVGGTMTSVQRVSPTVDSVTRKIKVTLNAPDSQGLIEGTQESCSIQRDVSKLATAQQTDNGGVIVPLSAVSVIGVDHYVFEVVNEKAISKQITPGALLGGSIIIYGARDETIVSDARGIRDGQDLIIK